MKGKLNAALVLAAAVTALGFAPRAQAGDTEANATPQDDTRELAASAHREAVNDALIRITESTRLELDVELPARSATPSSGD